MANSTQPQKKKQYERRANSMLSGPLVRAESCPENRANIKEILVKDNLRINLDDQSTKDWTIKVPTTETHHSQQIRQIGSCWGLHTA